MHSFFVGCGCKWWGLAWCDWVITLPACSGSGDGDDGVGIRCNEDDGEYIITSFLFVCTVI